jgi:hypothetical protein
MCANANPPGATTDSGSILVALASAKSAKTRRNDAETPEMENRVKIAESAEKQATSVDRKISVAPMMDDVESRALVSENHGLAPRPLRA